MVEDVSRKIRDLYDERVLKPELGEGALKQRLLDGLEQILSQVKLPQEVILEEQPAEDPLLDREIDYVAIHHVASQMDYKGVTARTASALRIHKIKTYRDLVRYVKELEAQAPERYGIRTSAGSFRSIFKMPNIGAKSHIILYEHLNSLGIKLFSDDYTPKELGRI